MAATAARRIVLGKKLVAALLRDKIFLSFCTLIFLVSLPWGGESLAEKRELWVDLVTVVLITWIAAAGIAAMERRERQFWSLWTMALGCWLIVRVAYVATPQSWNGEAFDLATDCLYMAFYLLLMLAAVNAPHRLEANPFGDRLRKLQLVGSTVLAFGLLIYFALIPGHLKPQLYLSWLPSFDLYVSLDVTVMVIYAALAHTSVGRWSVLYFGLGLTAACWAVFDLLEGLTYANTITLPSSAALNMLWNLPLLTLAAAIRGRVLLAEDDRRSAPRLLDTLPRFGSPLLLAAVALPGGHLALHALGLLDRDLQPAREILLMVGVSVLTGLALLEHKQLRRHALSAERNRRTAEKQAIERSTYLDALIEHSPLAILSLDAEYRVQLCNPAFERLFGYSLAELEGRTVISLLIPEEREPEARKIGVQVLNGERANAVSQRRHKDGHMIDVEIFGVPLKIEGKLMGIVASYRDLTDQVRAQEARQTVELRLRRLAEAAFEGIAVVDDERVVDANDQLATIFNVGTQKLLGEAVAHLVAPADRDELPRHLISARTRPMEIECLRKNHTTFRAEIRVRETEHAEKGSYVLAVRDLTERYQLEAQLRQAQKMEAIGRLAGGIAHDFNNLLTVIIGRCELLFAKASREQQAGLEEIKHAGEMAANLTRQLLVFARKQNPQPELLDINVVTAASAETMIRRLIPENVELDLSLSAETAWVRADRSQIEQLILNLALNAQHAMPNGGKLEVSTSIEDLEDELSAYGLNVPAGKYLCLTVKDTGVGIAPAVLPQLFDPFFTTKSTGTGLGLATVYGIIRQSSGGVTVESDLGWGTVFRVYLPITRTPPTTQSEPEEATLETDHISHIGLSRRQRVLVVEDVPAIGTMLRKYLERQGFDVMQAVRPRQALKMVEEHDGPIDLLLTDVVMPEMNGPELARAIIDRRPGIKVLFVSGYAREELHQQIADTAGAFLRKPFALAELTKTVRGLLADNSAAA